MDFLKQYLPVFNYTGRYLFLMSGAGTGKSFVMAQRILSDLLTNDKCFWLCLRKLHVDVGRSVFEQIKEVIDRFNLNSYFKINETNRSIYSRLNRSKAQFTGANDSSRIKSIAEVTNIFIEEADEIDEEDFDLLDTRCRSMNMPYNQLVLAFNPPEKTHWIPRRWFKSGDILPDFNQPLY